MQAAWDAKGLCGNCLFKRAATSTSWGWADRQRNSENTGKESGKPQADLSFRKEFQRRVRRRLKMRGHQGSRRGDRFGSPIKNKGKGMPVPVRQRGVELLWLKQSQPADLGGRTKVGKKHGCCWEKTPLSQCLYHFDYWVWPSFGVFLFQGLPVNGQWCCLTGLLKDYNPQHPLRDVADKVSLVGC